MIQIRWTPQATADLEHIILYIAKDHPDAAIKAARTILQHIEQLVGFRYHGRPGREPGTRELVFFSVAIRRRLPRERICHRNSLYLARCPEQELGKQ